MNPTTKYFHFQMEWGHEPGWDGVGIFEFHKVAPNIFKFHSVAFRDFSQKYSVAFQILESHQVALQKNEYRRVHSNSVRCYAKILGHIIGVI